MSIIDVARDALKEIPMADVLRERLSLALDQSADAERKVAALQGEKGALSGQLERERLDRQNVEKELQQLRELHAEEVRVVRATEFRRGVRTGGKWTAFCPRCHMPASVHDPQDLVACSDHDCRWVSQIHGFELGPTITSLQ